MNSDLTDSPSAAPQKRSTNVLLRAGAIVVCAVAGFLGARALTPSITPSITPSPAAPRVEATPPAPARARIPNAETPLLAEWEQLRKAQGTDAAQFPALFNEIKEMKDAFRRRAFRAALLAEWAALDPMAGITFLLPKDRANIGQLVREWLKLDPNAAVTGLLANEKTRGELRGLLSDIARAAPARLAEVVSALPKSTTRGDNSTENAFAIFAKNDPASARAAAESVTGPAKTQALAGVAKAWAEAEPAAALAWAQAMPAGDTRDGVLKAVLLGWAKIDPVGALDKIDLVPPGGEEMYFASDVGAQVLREAAKKDWDKTLQWLREHPGKIGAQSLNGMMGVLSQRLGADPSATLRTLSQSGMTGMGMVLGNALLNEGYAQRDAVWKWLDEQPPSDFTRGTRASLLNAMAWKEPDIALTHLEKLADDPANKELLENGTRSLLNGGSQMNRFEELYEKASPGIRSILLENAFTFGFDRSGIDPLKWLPRIEELPPERRGQALAGVARSWAANDPAAATQWALSLTDEQSRTNALSSATATWIQADRYEAASWINSLPAGADRDIATHGLVGALMQNEPESAWTWALSVQGAEQRTRALQLAYLGLRQKDPTIAQSMLQSANLPPEEIKALQQHPQHFRR